MSPIAAAVVAMLAATLAWRARALRRSGGIAAAAVGTLVLAGAGWMGGAVLMAFFLPATALSRLWPPPQPSGDAKGDRRDGWQVLANAGVPALALAATGPAAALAFAAGLAAAAADTCATAVGAHSRTSPRHLLRGHPVPPGANGGVTLAGTLGGAAGALLVAAVAAPLVGLRGAGAAAAIGVLGMLLDSALGAGLQGSFRCDQCGCDSEHRVHRCGTTTRHAGGFRWLTNDGVNALATSVATAAGWFAWRHCC